MTIETSDVKHGGTDAPAHMVLIGASGRQSQPVLLREEGKKKKEYKAGSVEELKVSAEALEPLSALTLATDGSDGWLPRKVGRCYSRLLMVV